MKSFTYVFSSILNTAILSIFAGHGGKQSVELSKDSFLWLSSVSLLLILTWVINILIEKSKPQIGDWIWKILSAHYVSGVGNFK